MIDEHRKDLERYRDELIQVAAVCVAIAEDLEFGIAAHDQSPNNNGPTQGELVLRRVHFERLNQDAKWGYQHHDPDVWLAILVEEVGEAAEELELPMKAEPHNWLIKALLGKLIIDARQLGFEAKHLLEKEIFA